jgi:hypothetical protein
MELRSYLVDGIGVRLAVALVSPAVDTADVLELTTGTEAAGLTHVAN